MKFAAGDIFLVSNPRADIGRRCANEGEICDCDGRVYYFRDNDARNSDILTNEGMDFASWLSRGKGPCSTEMAGFDPAPNDPKFCYCVRGTYSEDAHRPFPERKSVLNPLVASFGRDACGCDPG